MTLSQDPPGIQPSPIRGSSQSSVTHSDPLRFPPLGSAPQPIRLPGSRCLIRPHVSLAAMTSFRVGGPAELYVSPQTLEDLHASLAWAEARQLPITLLGAGSNLLISDRGLPGLVICTRHLRHMHFDADTGQVTVGAGEPLPRLSWQAAERGWSGLEWAVGIPGTIGGAVVMNAGAHTSCIADILVNAHVLTLAGDAQVLTPKTLQYSYRSSVLQTQAASSQPVRLVTQATLQLQPTGNSDAILATTTEHLNRRRTTQPYHLPSCGSVFRNPPPYTAGWLIEQTGLKGYQIGGAQVAQRHANFILNCGGASASDIFQLIHHVQEQVEQQWSLWLHPEVKMLGEFQAA
ncbi:UDP-N-acetylmuramate dehydrogenase [Thermocoleostomius sinensis]|uniref:UDP-N-acetylenolpyruvoylglucosamine reductase n=1 Tax=Thermocoleostomius sinensis A174 TaxID=2016057 RepID=A0A9E8ZAZ8_9CYAN|nr:UDP-N-acetylmuramate dehydrogenase [Thermocoleostomius sinensis]WAL59526.1 UDP-N-acetylmuramate dehydrogenase [Thermocoleostomius sinensis A174]